MLVSRFRVLVGLLTVFLSTDRMLLRFIMLTVIVVMRGLMVVMGGGLVFGSRGVMLIARSVLLFLGHYKLLTNDLRLDGLGCFRQSRRESPAVTSLSAIRAKWPLIRPRCPEVQRSYLIRRLVQENEQNSRAGGMGEN
jgi:hypothetical protein